MYLPDLLCYFPKMALEMNNRCISPLGLDGTRAGVSNRQSYDLRSVS